MTTVVINALRIDRFDRVRFGTLTKDGKQCVLVPRFTAGKCTLEHVQELNRTSPIWAKNMTEELLTAAISQKMDGKSPPRVLHGGGIFTPLDQEAASKLIQLGFKRLDEAHIIPI